MIEEYPAASYGECTCYFGSIERDVMRNILTGAVLVILGIGFSIWGHGVMMTTRASLKWPITQGNITFSEIKATSKTGPGYYYSPDVRYKYTVNGKDYNGNKVIAADYSSSSASRAGKIIRQHTIINVF